MCYSQDGDEKLLVLAARNSLLAYNTNTGKLEWERDRKPQDMEKSIDFHGVATDGRGHLFVCDWMDGNKCIHLFRASDGQHLVCLVKDEEEISAPGRIHWCEKSSSLITACYFKDDWHINVISVQY